VAEWKARYKNLREKVGKGVAGPKGTLIAAGVGAGVGYGEAKLRTVSFFANNWYATGGACVVGGHFLRKKNDGAGLALSAVGGFILAQDYQAHSAASSGSSSTANASGFNFANAGAPTPRLRRRATMWATNTNARGFSRAAAG
jgi:hypothetical protein